MADIGSPAFRRKALEWIPSPAVQKIREIVDIMDNTSRNILQKKKEAMEKGDEAVQSQVGRGKDIMSILRMSWLLLDLIFHSSEFAWL